MRQEHYQEKQLWVFAGPNGAGKSTTANIYLKGRIPIINPDSIALTIDPKNRNDPKVVLQAGKEAFRDRLQKLEQDQSFAIETTFSGRSELRLMEEAKKRAYKVNLIYIGIDGNNISLKRITDRVAKGGHSVPKDDIERRYSRSMENLKRGLKIADRAYVLDNSEIGRKPTLQMRKEWGKVAYLKKTPLLWFKKIMIESVREYDLKNTRDKTKEKGMSL